MFIIYIFEEETGVGTDVETVLNTEQEAIDFCNKGNQHAGYKKYGYVVEESLTVSELVGMEDCY